ncbi:MAG: N-acetyl sugar amidotransferase [Alphaproteobacteria bacterium]|nr:N-acetyl sugar amidotransferase [Alphaproteobacteria bacterium]
MIRYCRRCVLPETKPDLHIDDAGVCNACRNYERRTAVDWDARWRELGGIFDRYRSKDRGNWDCVIPVSGGKDSTFQVLKVLDLGANPLCVTAHTDKLTSVGRRNLDNLSKLGVDVLEFKTNPVIRRRINRLALRQVGDIAWPEHLTIFTVPVRVAVQYEIPLIVWGENPQNEYGGPAAAVEGNTLDRRWLEEFGGLLGLRVSDLIGQDGIEQHHLVPYTYPTDAALKRVGVTGLFLGYFVPWDGFQNALIAQAHGFETWPHAIENAFINYENLDNAHMGIHDHFKFLKYGYGRASDNASMHIRRDRLQRKDAIAICRRYDGRFPSTYLGVRLEEILGDIEMEMDEFLRICERFTNKKLFVVDNQGKPIRDKDGNLTKINYDNAG